MWPFHRLTQGRLHRVMQTSASYFKTRVGSKGRKAESSVCILIKRCSFVYGLLVHSVSLSDTETKKRKRVF